MKIYKIWHKSRQEYIDLGYGRKVSWRVFPSQAIKYSIYKNSDEIEVHEFEYEEIFRKKFSKDKKEII